MTDSEPKSTVRRFSDNRELKYRALQIYQILVGAARSRQIVTYKIVADHLGYEGSGVLDRQLGHIMFWCYYNGLPSLTEIVVNSKTGKPGVGLIVPDDHDFERERVFKENWYQYVPPTVDELELFYEYGMSHLQNFAVKSNFGGDN